MSPLTASLLSCSFVWLMCKYVLNEKTHSFGFRLQILSLTAAISITFIVNLVFSLVFDDILVLLRDLNSLWLFATFVLSFGLSRFLVIHSRTDGVHSNKKNMVQCFLTPWRTQFIEEIINSKLREALLEAAGKEDGGALGSPETSPTPEREGEEEPNTRHVSALVVF